MMQNLAGVGMFHPQSDDERALWARFVRFVGDEAGAFSRDPHIGGHITASAFVLSQDHQSVLLTHHKKLGLWLQLGGHCDGIADAPFVALKEAYEESGLTRIIPLQTEVFDIDILPVPAFGADPAHVHYDVRFLMQAAQGSPVVSDESLALAWVALTQMEDYSQEPTMLRMRDKALAYVAAT